MSVTRRSISCMRMPSARSIPSGTTVNTIYIAHSAPFPATSPVVTDSAPTEEAELSHTMPRRGSAHRPNRQDGQGNPLPLRVPRSSCASAYAYQSHNRHTLDCALGARTDLYDRLVRELTQPCSHTMPTRGGAHMPQRTGTPTTPQRTGSPTTSYASPPFSHAARHSCTCIASHWSRLTPF